MPKPVADRAKLASSYSMLLTGILLQLSDKNTRMECESVYQSWIDVYCCFTR